MTLYIHFLDDPNILNDLGAQNGRIPNDHNSPFVIDWESRSEGTCEAKRSEARRGEAKRSEARRSEARRSEAMRSEARRGEAR